jgi:hypothetical protein
MTGLFAEDYFAARGTFLAAAARAGLAVETILHPTATAPNGAPLAIDVARAGAETASHVLFTVCGTHGVEGYPGSAAMVQLLSGHRMGALPPHVGIVFLHGLNPYGWSRDSRRDENGVDVNRNFADFDALPAPDHDLIARFAACMDFPDLTFAALQQAMAAIWTVRDEVGPDRFMQALGAGQYVEPRGLKYGGTEPSWSNAVYRDIVRRYLGSATHIAEVDWHSGFGAYGTPFPIFFGERDSDEYRRTCAWWGQEAVDRGMASWSEDDDATPAPEYQGLTHMGLREELPDARLAGGVVEFGTLPILEIGQAEILDCWLHFQVPKNGDPAFWRALLRTLMAPREPWWERSVLRHAEHIYDQTLAGLAGWDA